MHRATINLHELNICFQAAPAMSGATATRATGCSWRRSSGSSAPARPGAIFPNVLAIGRTRINDFPDGPKAAFGRVYSRTLADDPDKEYAMIDATIVRAYQHSAGARKRGIRTKRSAARAED